MSFSFSFETEPYIPSDPPPQTSLMQHSNHCKQYKEKEDETEEDDGTMPSIDEEFGKEYMSRFNNMRRHTISSNADNDKLLKAKSEIMKSTENLLLVAGVGGSGGCGLSNANQILHQQQQDIDMENASTSNVIFPSLVQYNSSQKPPNSSLLSEAFGGDLQSQLPTRLLFATGGTAANSATSHYHHPHHGPTRGTGMSSHNRAKHNRSVLSKQQYHYQHQQQFIGGVNLNTSNSSSNSNNNSKNIGSSGVETHQQLNLLAAAATATATRPVSQLVNGRRASDGGSNISLFNQFYSLKNPFAAVVAAVAAQQSINGSQSIETSNSFNNNSVTNLMTSTGMAVEDSSSNSSGDSSQQQQFQNFMYKPRGSITSGMPVVYPNNNNHHSSGEDEENENQAVAATNLSFGGKFHSQRKSSKSRHEPYLLEQTHQQSSISPSSSFLNNNNNSYNNNNTNNLGSGGRSRGASFSSSSFHVFPLLQHQQQLQHRGSESAAGQIELISANMLVKKEIRKFQ